MRRYNVLIPVLVFFVIGLIGVAVMYNDILGEPEKKSDEEIEKNRKKINLIKHKVCYDCGNPYDLCECDEGFGLGDFDDDQLEHSCSPDCNKCDDSEDTGCMGVGVLKDSHSNEDDDVWEVTRL